MNKYTLAAAVALTMGATVWAADCTDTPTVICDPAAYDLSVSLKSTVAKGKSVKAAVCEDTASGFSCYRVKGSKSLKGYVVLCSCWCATTDPVTVDVIETNWSNGQDLLPEPGEGDGWNPVITTNSFTTGGGYETSTDWIAYLWDKKAKTFYAFGDDFTWALAGLIGKKKTGFEGIWDMEASNPGVDIPGVWTGAGQGAWDNKKKLLKNASGNFVVALAAPAVVNKKAEDEEDCLCIAPWIDPCTLAADDTIPTAGFGTWKLKYNSKASKTYEREGIEPLLPKFWN